MIPPTENIIIGLIAQTIIAIILYRQIRKLRKQLKEKKQCQQKENGKNQ